MESIPVNAPRLVAPRDGKQLRHTRHAAVLHTMSHPVAHRMDRLVHRLARCLGREIESGSSRQALWPIVALSLCTFLRPCQKYGAGALLQAISL